MKIFLAPGHGGKDPGAIGLRGLQEKNVTMRVAERLERILVGAGHIVALSRIDDTYVSPDSQRMRANRWGADVVISIHLNAAENREARGYEVWTTRGLTRSDALGTAVYTALGDMLPGEPGRRDDSDGDPDKESDFAVLRCLAPAILVELGFISHPATEEKFERDAYIDLCARALALGLDRWLSVAKGATA